MLLSRIPTSSSVVATLRESILFFCLFPLYSFRETNLKCRQCLTETAEMMDNHELIGQFDGEIVCETPNNLLNKFDGTLTWRGRK